jgi:iron complex outermembrane receptor protein
MTLRQTPGLSVGTALILAALGAPAAHAQTSAAPELKEPEERTIVVSIKNPSANLDSYAGSASEIDVDDLDARNVTDIASLSYVAPNVSLDPIGTFKGVANFSIRGLGINSSIPSIEPAVGLFVDGVYMGVNAGTVFDLVDVRNVELLRGPQGVAFGHNTTGGAVLINTADPSFEWLGHASLAYEGPVDGGRGGPMATARAVVSGPLSDKLAMRLAILHSTDSGYFRNQFTGGDLGKSETTVLRGGLTFEATSRLTLTAKMELIDSNGDGAATHNNGQFPRDEFDLSINQPGFYDSKNRFAVLRAEYELDTGVITNIAGWRKYRQRTRNDIDSSPAKIFESDTGTRQEQWSNELYYAADLGRASFTLGAYLFHQDLGYDEVRDLTGIGGTLQYGGGTQDHDVYGFYGQLDYDVATALALSVGARWSREEKGARVTYVRPRAACSAIAGTCPISGKNPSVATAENNGFVDRRSWSNLAPRVALTWTVAPTTRIYASATRGFRSGGYNLRITQPAAFESVSAAVGSLAFEAERIDSFEAGVKWRSADHSARIEAAFFWMDVNSLQREINVPSATSGLAQSIYNTADARIRGGEIEAEYAVTPNLRVAANLGYIDARYTDAFYDINSDGVIDEEDLALALPRAPEWTYGGSIEWSAPIGKSEATVFANMFYQHRAKYAYTDNNWGYNSPSNRLDAGLGVNLGNPAIRFTLFGRNLLDELQFGGDTQLPFAGGGESDGTNEPFDPNPAAGTFSPAFKGRTVGVEVSMDF